MNVPFSFWLGFAILVVSGELVEWLPGEATWADLARGAVLLPLPTLWLAVAARWACAKARPGLGARLMLRMAPLSVPIAIANIALVGGLLEFVEHRLPDLHTLRFVCLLAPLLIVEIQLRVGISRLARRASVERPELELPFDFGSGSMIALIATAALMLGAGLDLLATFPSIAAFVEVTDMGTTVGMLAAVVLGSWWLPILFRFILPTSRRLPPTLEKDLRAIAGKLGFRDRDLLSLDTGMRLVNAALVGPLRWPRYLVLTDGILAYLEPQALRGVVAHEIGHARAGHPALLILVFLVIPITLYQPFAQLDLHSIPPGWLLAAGAALAIIVLICTRALMHRFEFEADDLSAHALGGAEPCIVALTRVGELFPGHRFRSSFRHPSEVARVQTLVAHQHDDVRRAAFRRRGRRLRAGVAIATLAALAVSVVAHARTYAIDRAALALWDSRFDDAARWLQGVDPELEPRRVERLGEEIAAAQLLLDRTHRKSATLEELADSAFAEGTRLADEQGPEAARPYFALALATPHSEPSRASASLWSECTEPEQLERARRIAIHIVGLRSTPAALRAVMTRFAGLVKDG